jgi:DNA-binding PadR family transcriptional regulator
MNTRTGYRHPLTLDSFAVLVALSAGEQIGSEIQSQMIGDGVGLYVRSSSVYAILHRFEEMGLVETRDSYYKLTDKGWKRLELETRTMESLVGQSKKRIIDGGRGRW